jgi:hypothetical protein
VLTLGVRLRALLLPVPLTHPLTLR